MDRMPNQDTAWARHPVHPVILSNVFLLLPRRQSETICHPRRHRLGGAHQHQPQPLLHEPAEEVRHLLAPRRVHAEERVVEHEELGVAEQCAGNAGAARLAVRQRHERLSEPVREAEPRRHRRHLVGRRRAAGTEERVERQRLLGVAELEALLVVVPGVTEQPRVLLERHVAGDVGDVLRLAAGGAEAVEERPREVAAAQVEAPE